MEKKEQMKKEEFITLIHDVVKEALKEMGAVETRKGVVFETPETKAEEIEKLSPEEKLAKFFTEGVFAKNEAVVKDLGGSVGSQGGYLIPTEFSKEIIQELNQLTPMRKYATIFPVGSRTGEIPAEATKPVATRGTENAPANQSDPVFSQLTWALTRIDVFTALSKELIKDTPINIVAYIRKAFADAIAVKENADFTNGTGTNEPLGIRSATITTVAPITAGSISYDDVVNLKYGVPAQYRRNLVLMTSTKGIERLRQIKDTQGRPIFDPEKEQILGMKIVENPDIPENLGAGANETEIYVGDFSYYYVFEDGQIEIVATTEGGAMRNNQIWIAAFKRDDGKPVLTTPFVKFTGLV